MSASEAKLIEILIYTHLHKSLTLKKRIDVYWIPSIKISCMISIYLPIQWYSDDTGDVFVMF